MTHTDHSRRTPTAATVRVLAAAALALGLLPGIAAPAAAQGACKARGAAVAQLAKRYAEAPVSMGLADNGAMFEVFSSSDGATWTIVMTRPDGMSCLIAAGEAWEKVPLPLPGRPA